MRLLHPSSAEEPVVGLHPTRTWPGPTEHGTTVPLRSEDRVIRSGEQGENLYEEVEIMESSLPDPSDIEGALPPVPLLQPARTNDMFSLC